MSKRTPWFPASVKPVREGAYEGEIEVDGCICRCYQVSWRNEMWHVAIAASADGGKQVMMADPFGLLSRNPSFRWRGLTRPAEES